MIDLPWDRFVFVSILLRMFHNQELYVSCSKRKKMAISKSIVEAIRSQNPPGRFLERSQETNLWSDIGDRKATEKTSQALRDGAASLRKKLSAELGDPEFMSAVFDDKKTPKEKGKEAEVRILWHPCSHYAYGSCSPCCRSNLIRKVTGG